MFLGIDLGTTYSAGAYIDENGNAAIVETTEGTTTIPSVVYIEDKDNIIVGQAAKDQACIHPKDVVSFVKNIMGKTKPDGGPEEIVTSSGEVYTPEVISSFILRKIVAEANAALGVEEPIKDVVVTIPAYFNDAQRKATEDAIAIAGLNRLGLINEPTAAALYYSTKSNINNANILVYDLGGGTFDVTIVSISGDSVEVKSTGGLSRVGGSFFDKEITRLVCSYIKDKYDVNLEDEVYADVYQDILGKAEKAKIALSKTASFSVTVRVGQIAETISFTRDDINRIVESLYGRTESVVRKALKDAELETADIDKVIMVGGSSRIPYIAEHIEEFFGQKPSREVNPDEVVALGAAVYAAQLKKEGEAKKKIIDVCSHGIGIKAYDPDKDEEYNDILIKRNTKLPASAEKVYAFRNDKISEFYLCVMEGDRREIKYTTKICDSDIQLPTQLNQGERVHLRLEMDKHQLLHIFVRIPSAGNVETEVTFDRTSNLSQAQISKWKESTRQAQKSIDDKNSIKGFFAGIKDKITGAAGTSKAEETPKEVKRQEKPKDKSKEIPKVIKSAMDGIIGMDEVSRCLRDIKNRFDMENKRSALGKNDFEGRCVAVYGKRGMGKTTAAFRIADALYKIGASSKEKPVLAHYDDIVKGDEQETKNAISEIFNNAVDGVLIIDDFEEFYSENENAVGMVAVSYLQKAYERSGKRISIIIAGQDYEIKKLFEAKPRFERIFQSFTIQLLGYSPKECVELIHMHAAKAGYVIDDLADSALEAHFKRTCHMPEFEYFYSIEDLFEKAKTDVANKASAKRHATNYDYTIIRDENFGLTEGVKDINQLKKELNDMIGLAGAKKQIQEMIDIQEKTVMRAKTMGISLDADLGNMHMVFTGNPGTGKTTVARLLGEIYRELGVLEKGQFIEVTRKDLVSDIVGRTKDFVADAVEKAIGGILFIDEAYSLYQDDNDSYGREAVDTLVPLIENHRNELMVIMAGYTKEMSDFMSSVNPGIPSRFNTYVDFEDYSVDELVQIFHFYLDKKEYIIEGRAEDALKELISRKSKDPKFGNARGVRNIYEKVIKNHLARLAALDDWGDNEEKIIRLEDLGVAATEDSGQVVNQLLDELYSYTGLMEVKNQVKRIVNTCKVNLERKAKGLSVSDIGTMHMIFAGNPGTGKTTIARLIGRIYKELGILAEGRTIECKREDLVAGYVGQTAMKTKAKLNEALGNVLFIDEAYTLAGGGENDYGSEAIDTLVAEIENNRNSMVVILAGYTDRMQGFLDVNEGLESRFKNWIRFEDYSLDEMMEIFAAMVKQRALVIEDTAVEGVRNLIASEVAKSPVGFANARGVRNIVERICANMDSRIAEVLEDSGDVSEEMLTTILASDIY